MDFLDLMIFMCDEKTTKSHRKHRSLLGTDFSTYLYVLSWFFEFQCTAVLLHKYIIDVNNYKFSKAKFVSGKTFFTIPQFFFNQYINSKKTING